MTGNPPNKVNIAPSGSINAANYESLLGRSAWLRLHPDIRSRFCDSHAHLTVLYRGVMRQVFMSFAGRLLAHLCRLIGTPLALYNGHDVPIDVHVYADTNVGGMTWDRYYFFRNRKVNRVKSTKCITADTGLMEIVGSGFGMFLTVSEQNGALCFESTRFFFSIGNKKITIPHLFTPGKTTVKQTVLANGRFRFTLTVNHPLLGLVFYQDGEFSEVVHDVSK